MKKIRNIGIVAHVDAGKTTVTEQMLYASGKIKMPGDVNKGTSNMDYTSIERQRGITVFAEQTFLHWRDIQINIIDTPGHVDFSTELERSIRALDGAILIISSVEGVQAHTETIWHLLKKHHIPTLFFINKLDRVGANLKRVYTEIEKQLTKDYITIQTTDNLEKKFDTILDCLEEKEYQWVGQIADFKTKAVKVADREELIEKVADRDDTILNKYLGEENITYDELLKSLRDLVGNSRLYPVLIGSSIKGIGIPNLLDYIVKLLPPPKGESNKAFAAVVYKIRVDENVGKLTFIKVKDGIVKVRDTIFNGQQEEKVTEIRIYNGERYTVVSEIEAGDIGVLCGISTSRVGDSLGAFKQETGSNEIVPVLISRIVPPSEDKITDTYKAFEVLNLEDPALNLKWDPQKKDMTISVMGMIQIEIIKELVAERFGLEIELEEPKVNYLETITEVSRGFCHFEPKKHFAEVEVEIEPLEQGTGIAYNSELRLEVLPIQYQRAIEKVIPEALEHGNLIGGGVTDIKVELIAGQYDLEHTHGGDFRQATIRAIRQALEQNKPILLEPIYSFKITVTKDYLGKVMSDILKMKGTFNEPVIQGDHSTLSGEVPIATSMYYSIELASMTSGNGSLHMKFLRYEPCHNQDEVIANHKSRTEDRLYNSVSLFREKRKMKKIK